MNYQDKNNVLFKILSGKYICDIDNIEYVILPPTIDILNNAQKIYFDVYYTESFNDKWCSGLYINKYLVDIPNIDIQIDNLNKKQEDLKINMFESYLNSDILNSLRKHLNMVKDKVWELYEKKHMFDYLTAHGFAAMIKAQYILYATTYHSQKKVFNCHFDDVDYILLNNIMRELDNNRIDDSVIRALARSDIWRKYWNIHNATIFKTSVLEWTDEQRALISYSQMYDKIFDHPECPNHSIINDDDVLDGWLLKLSREKQNNQKEVNVNKILAKHQKNTEIFLPAKNLEEAKKIDELNSPMATRIKQQREKAIRDKGEIKEADLPDVALDRFNKRNI